VGSGPAAVLSYLAAGPLVVLVMRMLGEMAVAHPSTGSFADYAGSAMGDWARFAVGWLYWYFWVIVLAVEAAAGAAISQEWLPGVPILSGIVIVIFAFVGAEIATIAAAESNEPGEAVTRATNSVIVRVLTFYVLSVFLIVAILPWNSAELGKSPFAAALGEIGFPAAEQVMNAVVLTAVLSCLNSGLYVASRMNFALARRGDAPQWMVRLNGRGVPGTGDPRGDLGRLPVGDRDLAARAAAPVRARGPGRAAGADVAVPVSDVRSQLYWGVASVAVVLAAHWIKSRRQHAGGDAGLGGAPVGGRFAAREDRERDPAAEALQ
jgi:amino acid transporter